jgi:cold shock CspA family protein
VERGTGTVSFYDPDRNYGFIEPDDDGADVSFSLRPGDPTVQAGDRVTFDISPRPLVTDFGRQAIRVTRMGSPIAMQ